MQRQRVRHLRAVDQRQALFCRQHDGRDTCLRQRFGRRHQFAVDAHVAHTQHGQGHVRQGRQVARGADGALGGNGRHDARVVQRDQGVDDQRAHAGKAARQAADLHQHDQAHDGVRQQFSRANRVRQDQVALQLLQLFIGDARLGKQAETRVDAVGRIALGDDGLHGGGRRLDDGIGLGGEDQFRGCGPDGAQVAQGHRARLQGPTFGMLCHSHSDQGLKEAWEESGRCAWRRRPPFHSRHRHGASRPNRCR